MTAIAVIDLSGVGPVLATRLNQVGVYTTGDLLRAERGRLAAAVDGVSVQQLRRWQAVAELLEVEGLTLAVAEPMYERGVESLDELSSRPLSTLRGLVTSMQNDGDIAAMPSDDDLVVWLTDAMRLRHTGTLNGTITSTDDTPVTDVSVSCMGQQTVSDARGRFRLRRLPLGRALQVSLEHPDFKATTQPSSIAPPGVLRGERFRLLPKPAHATAPAAARVLSELNGDRLPDLGSAPFTTRAQTGEPSHRDVLCVQEFLAGGDARLVSCLFDYDNGIFVVRTYRFEQTDLPGSIELRDHLVFRDGKWVAADMTAGEVERYRRKLRERRYWQLPDHPTADDIDRAIETWQRARATDRTRPGAPT